MSKQQQLIFGQEEANKNSVLSKNSTLSDSSDDDLERIGSINSEQILENAT